MMLQTDQVKDMFSACNLGS